MMKIIKYIFFIIWTVGCLNGILKNYSHYSFLDWIIIIGTMSIPYIFLLVSLKKKNKVLKNSNIDTQNIGIQDKKSMDYVETDNKIFRADEKPITDQEISHLMQIGYEKALQSEKESPNPKFHRTTREENLSFNFEMKYSHEIENLTEKFESPYRSAYKTNDLDRKISLLNDAAYAFENAKKFCYSKGKGGTLYFQDTWEYLHNSNNECFSYLDNIQDALEDAIYLRDEVIPNIIDIISKNDGMLQRNIYKMLPDIDRSTIQRTLKILDANNSIIRNKTGNSYELHIST